MFLIDSILKIFKSYKLVIRFNKKVDNYVPKKTYQQQWQEDYDNSITIEEFQSLPDNEKRGKIVRI